MKVALKAGSTSVILQVFISDSASTTGAGKTGLLYNSAGLVCYYRRQGAGNAGGTAVTLATATRGTYASGGFVEIDATNMPGWYELHLPNAVFASGASWVAVHLKGASGMADLPIEIQLTPNSLADFADYLDTANLIETGLTGRQALRGIAAATLGKVSGAGTSTITFRNAVADTADRIVATVDASGNRTALTLTL